MRKLTVFLLLTALLLCGCGRKGAASADKVTFYYPRTDILYGSAEGVLAPEERETSISGNSLEERLNIYFSGPKGEGLENPFPAGTELLSLRQEGGDLIVVLNDAFFRLEGVDLTVACASLAKTCFSLTEESELTVSSEDYEHRIIMTRDSFLFSDERDTIEMTIGTEPAE